MDREDHCALSQTPHARVYTTWSARLMGRTALQISYNTELKLCRGVPQAAVARWPLAAQEATWCLYPARGSGLKLACGSALSRELGRTLSAVARRGGC